MDTDAHDLWARMGRFLRRVPRQERARSVVAALLDAADEDIDAAERGALERLNARAGVAAGSFYEYFASREALLATLLERFTAANFSTFVAEIERVTATEATLEGAVRRSAVLVVGHYLRRPGYLRTFIRLAARLSFLEQIARDRDRFSDTVAARIERLVPQMSPGQRSAMIRAVSDTVTGLVVVAVHRVPVPPAAEVAATAADAAWGVAQQHLARVSAPPA